MHCLLGHVRGVWEFWPWCRRPSFSLCSVRPVLPSILCRHKGTFSTDSARNTSIGIASKRMSILAYTLLYRTVSVFFFSQITKVVLSKGWRCLECTVCEACGQATDPGRLLLCDDCDISYHTYCLDPPLQNVPKDSWKCKWCISLRLFLELEMLNIKNRIWIKVMENKAGTWPNK